MFPQELLWDLNRRKQLLRGQIFKASRFLVLACLLQVNAVGRTVERQFPLFTAALRADAPVDCRAEALFLANVAEWTTQPGAPRRPETRPKVTIMAPSPCRGSAGPA